MQSSHDVRPAPGRDYLFDLRTAHHTIILRRPRRASLIVASSVLLVVGAAGAFWMSRGDGGARAGADPAGGPATSVAAAPAPGEGLFDPDPAIREQAIVGARQLLDPSLVPDLLTVFENEEGWRQFVVAAAADPDGGVLERFAALDRHERKLIVFALSGYRLESLRAFFEAVLATEQAAEIRRLATIAIYRLDRDGQGQRRSDGAGG